MIEATSLIGIGIALSMDAFSVALGIGIIGITKLTHLKISIIVGIFHFMMPLLGIFIGENISYILNLNTHLLMSVILLFIAFDMIKNLVFNIEKEYNLSTIGILLLAFSVSFDSFTTGFGLSHLTSNIFLASIIFSIFSFLFTYLGLSIGKYSKRLLGVYATIIGAVLLVIISAILFFM